MYDYNLIKDHSVTHSTETQNELLNSDTSITFFSHLNVFTNNHLFPASWSTSEVLRLACVQTSRFPDKFSFQIMFSLRSESGK